MHSLQSRQATVPHYIGHVHPSCQSMNRQPKGHFCCTLHFIFWMLAELVQILQRKLFKYSVVQQGTSCFLTGSVHLSAELMKYFRK